MTRLDQNSASFLAPAVPWELYARDGFGNLPVSCTDLPDIRVSGQDIDRPLDTGCRPGIGH
jgi:hypothetical protein